MRLRLKEVLKDKKITSKRLAEMMTEQGTPIHVGSLSRIINEGKYHMSTIINIANVLDVQPVELFDLQGFDAIYTKDEDLKEVFVGFLKKGYSAFTR